MSDLSLEEAMEIVKECVGEVNCPVEAGRTNGCYLYDRHDCKALLRDKVLDLLKDREQAEPKCTVTSHGFHYDYCGGCGALLPVGDYGKANFCPACGKPVKWDE